MARVASNFGLFSVKLYLLISVQQLGTLQATFLKRIWALQKAKFKNKQMQSESWSEFPRKGF